MNAIPFRPAAITLALALAALLSGCAVGPVYERPVAAAPATWKEAPADAGWLPAAPADLLDRGPWWQLFGDTTLDALAERVQVSNQNIAVAVANYAQAQALVRAQRAALFPSLGLSGSASRSALAHAIAVLVGTAPADFDLPVVAAWTPVVPSVPLGLPSTLLQRRPDIAAAERSVAVANAQIGIQRSAYFPSLSLSASLGRSSTGVSELFSASNLLWSLGLSATQVIFDAGAIGARVDAARAAYDASVASYRQTVLSAFQAVEDQLTATASLAQQEVLRREASAAADRTEQQILNRYRAGQVGYTEVVTAQASALNARRTVLQLVGSRQTAAVGLIQALGGGWSAPEARLNGP